MPVNFKGMPTTRGRGYEAPNLIRINEGLKPMPIDQRAAILGSIIEESGGNPLIANGSGAYQGLLQWGADRYRLKSSNNDIELNNQIQYINETIDNSTDGKSWTHGGKGSGYNSKNETYNTFHNDDVPFDKKFRALSFGYVRPQGKEDSYNNRLKVGKKVLNELVVNEVLSKPQSSRNWTPKPFKKSVQFSSKYDEGGYLDNTWDSLSLAGKAEMIKVAVANGITTLPEIRSAYNEFAKGGYIPSASIKKRISNWEGSSMKTNRSFEAEAKDFNRVIPEEIRSKLSPKQLDALYSYGYNVGMGNLKERVVPTLTAYTKGKASKEDVQRSMWAKRDNELKGLTTRRNTEREMFGGNYRTTFTGTGKLGTHIDPSEYTYYEDLSPMIDNINIPQMQFPDSMVTDPTTLYKAPTIDETLFSKPEVIPEEAIYNPQQERLEGLKRMNTIMGLLGQSTPFAGLTDTSTPGLLSYVNQIYNS